VRDEAVGQEKKPFPEPTDPRIVHIGAHWTMVPIADFFDCKAWHYNNNAVFFGVKSDVELAHQMLTVVCLAVDSEFFTWSKSAGSDVGQAIHKEVRTSFISGMAKRIGDRLRVMKEARSDKGRSRGTDLVVVKNQIVDEKFAAYLRQTNQSDFTKNTSKSSSAISETAFLAGWTAGTRVDLGDTKIGSGTERTGERPPDWLATRMNSLRDASWQKLKANDLVGARKGFEEALSIARALVSAAPEVTESRESLFRSLHSLAYCFYKLDDHNQAVALSEEAQLIATDLIKTEQANENGYRFFAVILRIRGLSVAQSGSSPALDIQREAVQAAKKCVEVALGSAWAIRILRSNLKALSQTEESREILFDAIATQEEVVKLSQKIAESMEADASDREAVGSEQKELVRLRNLLKIRTVREFIERNSTAGFEDEFGLEVGRLEKADPTVPVPQILATAFKRTKPSISATLLKKSKQVLMVPVHFMSWIFSVFFHLSVAIWLAVREVVENTIVGIVVLSSVGLPLYYRAIFFAVFDEYELLQSFGEKSVIVPLLIGVPTAVGFGFSGHVFHRINQARTIRDWTSQLDVVASPTGKPSSTANASHVIEYIEKAWIREHHLSTIMLRFAGMVAMSVVLAHYFASEVYCETVFRGEYSLASSCKIEVWGLALWPRLVGVLAGAALLGFLLGGLWPRAAPPIGESARLRRAIGLPPV
jgi:hypothetical protein